MGAPMFPHALMKAVQVGNVYFGTKIIAILGALAAATLVYNIVIQSVRYTRTLTCLNNDTQRFFKAPQPLFAFVKQHLLYAPLATRRHSKQMRIGPVEFGILPTRLQAIVLTGIIAMNVTFTAYGIEWHGAVSDKTVPHQTLLLHLRNRSGTLAVFNMIPLVVMAGRNNPLITWLGISFDAFNLLHRWFGRIVISLAIVHGTVELISMNLVAKATRTSGVEAFGKTLKEETFILWGFISFLSILTILLTSITSFRHAFYETFLHFHIALVSLILAGLWQHLAASPVLYLIKIIIVIWAIERAQRLLSLLYRNISLSRRPHTNATIETLPGNALRITVYLARPWTSKPGQHVFLTIPSIGLWTSHPFSVAWSTFQLASHTAILSPSPDPENCDSSILKTSQTSISFIIRRRSGFTNALFQKSLANNGALYNIRALVEGPYHSTPNTLTSYGTVLLIAGGVGITHSVPHVRHLVAGYAAGTVACRRLLLVWIIQSPEHLEWIRPWMTEILGMPHRREVLRIQLFVTRPRSTKEIHSPSATVQMFPGKPNVGTIVEMECREGVGAVGVSVCGPGGLADEVRGAVRRVQVVGNVDLVEEGFGW